MNKKELKERKEFLKFKRAYRLDHALFNWIHSTDPGMCGVFVWFMSGFLYISFLTGLEVFGWMIVTGIIGWFIAYMTHKEFNEKKNHGVLKIKKQIYLKTEISLLIR